MINYNQSQGEISECESDVDDRELLENFAGIINMDENDIPEDSDDEENESDDDEPQIKRMKIDESTVFSSDVEWKKNPSKVTSHLDSFVGETGPTSFSKNNIKCLLDTFMIFFPDEMKEKIVSCTNARASEKRKKEWMVMTISIFEKLLGIVILLGALKSAREKIRYVVQGPFSRFDKYRQYMIPAKLIVSYLANLCFENNVEEGDKFGCIRNIYQKFIAICGMAYNIGSEITVDETLIASKNRFKMRQFLKSKPAKYGLKF
uniref:DDE_Tnp_1_7 domain-containing protein n=1 Tax=Strongyloides papillosus TaxID=174720 RepID=A0A0N5B7M4_STREA